MFVYSISSEFFVGKSRECKSLSNFLQTHTQLAIMVIIGGGTKMVSDTNQSVFYPTPTLSTKPNVMFQFYRIFLMCQLCFPIYFLVSFIICISKLQDLIGLFNFEWHSHKTKLPILAFLYCVLFAKKILV